MTSLQVLDVPKSDLHITQGLKSRNKTVALTVNGGEEECVNKVMACLEKATGDS